MKGSDVALVACLGGGVATSVSLLLPWLNVGGPPRSTIEVISSANALDVITGATRLVVVASWAALPVSVAGALFAAAAGRRRLAAAAVGAPCLLLLVAAIYLAVRQPALMAWGAWVSAVAALGAVLSSVKVSSASRRPQ